MGEQFFRDFITNLGCFSSCNLNDFSNQLRFLGFFWIKRLYFRNHFDLFRFNHGCINFRDSRNYRRWRLYCLRNFHHGSHFYYRLRMAIENDVTDGNAIIHNLQFKPL